MKNFIRITSVTEWKVICREKEQKHLSVCLTGRICLYLLLGSGPEDKGYILRTPVSSLSDCFEGKYITWQLPQQSRQQRSRKPPPPPPRAGSGDRKSMGQMKREATFSFSEFTALNDFPIFAQRLSDRLIANILRFLSSLFLHHLQPDFTAPHMKS